MVPSNFGDLVYRKGGVRRRHIQQYHSHYIVGVGSGVIGHHHATKRRANQDIRPNNFGRAEQVVEIVDDIVGCARLVRSRIASIPTGSAIGTYPSLFGEGASEGAPLSPKSEIPAP
jgi:hypothetical protein